MDDDPLVPGPAAYPRGPEDTVMYNFFVRDPYTRRHRSRSMADVYTDTLPSSSAALHGVGTNGTAAFGIINGTNNVADGHVRLKSAEV